MHRWLIVILLIALVLGGGAWPVYAAETGKAIYSVPSSQAFENYLNEQDCITHKHKIDLQKKGKEASVQAEVGLDVPIVKLEDVDVISENRYNFETSVTTLGVVVEVKKSLWSMIKGLFGK